MSGVGQSRAYVALLAIAVLWGTFPATAKLALEDFPPVFLTAVRGVIASTFLVALLARAGAAALPALDAGALRAFALLGVLGLVISTQLSYVGIATTTAANAAILQASGPVMVALGARAWLGERLRRRARVGVAVSAVGVLLVVTSGGLAALTPAALRPGDFVTLVALVGWTGYTVYGKRVLLAYPPALVTTAAYVAGTAVLVALAALTAPLFPVPRLGSGRAWTVVVYQALFGAVAHVWWYRAVERVGASRAAVFMNVTPIVGIALAAAIVGEPIGPAQVIGTVFVLAGVALTTSGGDERR